MTESADFRDVLPPPLDGIVVVETSGAWGAYCGRLLALLGATVIKVEPPDGDSLRRAAPLSTAPGARSAAFLYNNLGKRSVCLDLHDAEQRRSLDRLLARADIFLSSLAPRTLAALGLEPEALVERYPRLVVTAVTPFGLTGPHREYEGTDLTGLASGGQLYLTGYTDRRPVKYGGYQAYKQASVHAAYGTLLALVARQRSGRGQVVDVSTQECIANALQTTMQLFDLCGEVRRRVGSRLVRCKDGYVRSMAAARGRAAVIEWLDDEGFPHDLHDLERSASARSDAAGTAAIERTLERFFLTRTKAELLAEALRRGIALTPVHTADEVLDLPGLAERGYWMEALSEDRSRELRSPGAPFRFHGGATAELRTAPRLGDESVESVLASLPPAAELQNDGEPAASALAGVSVLDFTWFGAGSMGTRVLAHFGARVIKVESASRIDGIRMAPPFRHEPGINLSGFFNNFNSGKLSITLDLHNARAVAVAEELVRRADVVADNFTPGVLARFGLSDMRLLKLNPRLVVLHMPMGGLSGALSQAAGFGATIEALAGLVEITGDPDRDPVGTEVNYPDYGPNPYHAATAMLAALYARRTTGRGCVIELSQIESTIAFAAEALLEAQLNGASPGRVGNRSGDALFSEVLPCAGEDEWCAVACRTEAELRALLSLAGIDEFPDTPDGLLVERLSAWSAGIEKYALAARLQERGVPAYPAATSRDLVTRDPQLAARRHYVSLDHPAAGTIRHDGPAVKLCATPGRVERPAPCLGQHTAEVLQDVLGLGTAAIEELSACGALV